MQPTSAALSSGYLVLCVLLVFLSSPLLSASSGALAPLDALLIHPGWSRSSHTLAIRISRTAALSNIFRWFECEEL